MCRSRQKTQGRSVQPVSARSSTRDCIRKSPLVVGFENVREHGDPAYEAYTQASMRNTGQDRSTDGVVHCNCFDGFANSGTRFFTHLNCPLSNHEEKQMKNIFVGNLSFQTTEQDIRSLFEAYGAVDR